MCSGKLISLKYLSKIILKYINKKLKIQNGIYFEKKRIDKFNLNYSNNKISKLVPKNSKHNLEDEIYKIINFYKNKKAL